MQNQQLSSSAHKETESSHCFLLLGATLQIYAPDSMLYLHAKEYIILVRGLIPWIQHDGMQWSGRGSHAG